MVSSAHRPRIKGAPKCGTFQFGLDHRPTHVARIKLNTVGLAMWINQTGPLFYATESGRSARPGKLRGKVRDGNLVKVSP